MGDMICGNCGQYGIRWSGWSGDNFTHTLCPHCGGVNCQQPEPVEEEEQEGEAGDG